MINSFFATKLETSSSFDEQGNRLVVTKLKISPLKVKQIKTVEKDGYSACVCAFTRKSLKKLALREIRLHEAAKLKVGDEIKCADVFQVGDLVKLTAVSKGRGFAGVVKRHGFKGGPKTHGQSDRQRAPGSIGMRTTPGRIWKGKKMAGHMGTKTVSIRNLKILSMDEPKDVLTVSGTIPGSRWSLVRLTKL